MNKSWMFDQEALWDEALLILRAWAGVLFLHFGKIVLHAGTMEFFGEQMREWGFPCPTLSAYISKSVEFVGGGLLLAGLLTRPVSLLLAVNMALATFMANKGDLFGKGEGSFVLVLLCIVLFLSSPGRYSLDGLIERRRRMDSLEDTAARDQTP